MTVHRWSKLALLALLAVVVGQVLVQGGGGGPREGAAPPPLALPVLDGGATLDLASLRGRVVAVNFWATWCAPCRRELPDLAAAWQAHRGRCFEILGVVEESAREDVELLARRIPYPVLVDQRAEAAAAWGVRAYPRTFLVDPEGRVRRVFEGAVGRGELEGAVAQLLPARCPERAP